MFGRISGLSLLEAKSTFSPQCDKHIASRPCQVSSVGGAGITPSFLTGLGDREAVGWAGVNGKEMTQHAKDWTGLQESPRLPSGLKIGWKDGRTQQACCTYGYHGTVEGRGKKKKELGSK